MCDLVSRIWLPAALVLATAIVSPDLASAGDGCCAHCGRASGCHQVCHLACEEKKVEITCWGCKCEDFCLPGPGTPGCRNCEEVCDFCDDGKADAPYAEPKKFVWTEWCPSWAKMHTKKKLMKKVVTKKVPSYKWVVEDLSAECEAKMAALAKSPANEVAPKQAADSGSP